MSGSLVISLDFELMWGVRDHRSVAAYGDAVLGVRETLPRMLTLFSRYRVRATWATVGLLFARDRHELLDHLPEILPDYHNPSLSPYRFIQDGLGESEDDDPWHYGASLLDRVAQTPGQEIASHTFSHYYCLEPGQSEAAFEADLAAAQAIAATRGLPQLVSLVFPRNQVEPAYALAAARQGMTVQRGNPRAWAYRPQTDTSNSAAVRAVRLLDGALPLVRGLTFADPTRLAIGNVSVTEVPASRFLRPLSRRLPGYGAIHAARIEDEMTCAARAGHHYHLWWHPHNFGRNPESNLARLERLLRHFRTLQDRYGFESRAMEDFKLPCRSLPAKASA